MVLCENGLRSRQGHHYNLVSGVRAELTRRGIPLAVLSNVVLEPELCAELAVDPVFTLDPYSSLMSLSIDGQIRSWLVGGWRFAAGLRRATVESEDVVLVLTTRPAELLGLACWSWSRRRLPRSIVLNFMTDDFRPARTFVSPVLVGLLYAVSFTLLRLRIRRRRLLLTCASQPIAASLQRRLRTRIAVTPMLKTYPDMPRRGGEGELVIGFLGTPRHDKGEHLLVDVIKGCAASLPQARVVAQLPANFAGPTGGWAPNVEVAPIGLDRDDYYALLLRVDVAVLPYRPDMFGDMTSGVFAEVAACGAASVVPTGSWMATMIRGGHAAGITFDEFSAAAIIDATTRAASARHQLSRQAADRQARWRAEQSISAYFERLLVELGPVDPGSRSGPGAHAEPDAG